MRIGLIIYGSLDTLSGGYLYDRMLAEYLASQGDALSVISLPWRNYADHLTDNLAVALRRRLQGASFDFLLQDELNHPSLFLLNRLLKPRVSYPIVSIVHHLRSSEDHSVLMRLLYRLVESQYLSSVAGFIFNGQTTRSAVEKLAGSRRPSVVAVPAGNRFGKSLAIERINTRAHREGPLKILFVGNLIPRKGLHVLLDALARLDRDRWRLTVIGSPDVDNAYAARTVRQIARANLARNVTLIGSISGSDLADQYANHQVLAVPSSYEGFGIAYLEAMGFGLPCIATTAGGAQEIIADGINGFLISPGDSTALAGCIQSLIVDRELLVQLSLTARLRFDNHPTWETSMRSVRSFLQRFPLPLPATSPLQAR